MRISKAIKPASFPSTFGVLHREGEADDFLRPYLRSEGDGVKLIVATLEIDDYPGPVDGECTGRGIWVYLHVNPVAGEVIGSLKVLAHEIGHHRTVGVAGFLEEDSEAQARSVGKHLMRKWLGR